MKGQHTIYAVIGDSFAWASFLFFVLVSIFVFRKKKKAV
jgi:cbb3-type cytochrome oxidase subunit 3